MNDFLTNNNEWIFYPLLSILYIGVLYLYFTMLKRTFAKRHSIKGFFKIYNETNNVDERLNELKLFFKKLKEKYSSQLKNTKSFIEILEDIYFIMTTKDNKYLKQKYRVEFDDKLRNTIVDNIMKYKNDNPFVALSPKMSTHLSNLKNSLDNNNNELGENVLSQLAEDIEINEKALIKQERTNKFSILLAVIGVFLTIVFGIKSFL